ncbi:hypothetical protein PTKIN_Ptkin15bG0021600 [Pterospermum kingtungense]
MKSHHLGNSFVRHHSTDLFKTCGGDSDNDWRRNLFIVYVSNISTRIQKSTLWQAFNSYGMVMNVFIKHKEAIATTFGFVRYKTIEECRRAIEMENNSKVDEKFLKVKMAEYGWSNRRSTWKQELGDLINVNRMALKVQDPKSLFKERDHRTYLQALLGQNKGCDEGKSKVNMISRHIEKDDDLANQPCDDENMVISYNTVVPHDELGWLSCCIICDTKDPKSSSRIQKS